MSAGARTEPPPAALGAAHVRFEKLHVPGVVDGLDLRLADGEALSVIGPQPAAATRLLRAIAGLDACAGGTIAVAGAAVQDLPPGRRGVAMVLRDLALYPHLDVEGNILFPLRSRTAAASDVGVAAEDPGQRVAELASQLDLEDVLAAMPDEISPRQAVCVALARAVARRPRLLLVDDVLGRPRGGERIGLRDLVRRLQQSWRLTTIYATASSEEAMCLGDRVAVIAAGDLQQIDTPSHLYANPATVAVATSLGTPPINMLAATLENRRLRVGAQTVEIDAAVPTIPTGAVLVGIRPEAFDVNQVHKDALVAIIDPASRETLGSHSIVRGRVDDQPVIVYVAGSSSEVARRAYANGSALLLFDADTGRRLR